MKIDKRDNQTGAQISEKTIPAHGQSTKIDEGRCLARFSEEHRATGKRTPSAGEEKSRR
jgi:hypothetical protein